MKNDNKLKMEMKIDVILKALQDQIIRLPRNDNKIAIIKGYQKEAEETIII